MKTRAVAAFAETAVESNGRWRVKELALLDPWPFPRAINCL